MRVRWNTRQVLAGPHFNPMVLTPWLPSENTFYTLTKVGRGLNTLKLVN